MLKHHRREISVAFAIAALLLLLAAIAPGFFTLENQRELLLQNMPVLIVALGMTLVILTGNIDISVGSVFAICSVAAGGFAKLGLPMPIAGLAACLVGAALGAMNGTLVAYARIPSIVVTLATMAALRDALRWSTEGAWIQDLPPNFQWFGWTQPWSDALTFSVAILLLAGMSWGLRNLAAGRAVYASGSNENGARLAGINTALVTFTVFIVIGALTGCAALLNSVRFNQIPSNAGLGLELKVIAAAVVGGTATQGGKGTLLGTVLGVVFLGIIGPALTFLGFSAYWERAIQGGIILSAVSADAIRLRMRRYAAA